MSIGIWDKVITPPQIDSAEEGADRTVVAVTQTSPKKLVELESITVIGRYEPGTITIARDLWEKLMCALDEEDKKGKK